MDCIAFRQREDKLFFFFCLLCQLTLLLLLFSPCKMFFDESKLLILFLLFFTFIPIVFLRLRYSGCWRDYYIPLIQWNAFASCFLQIIPNFVTTLKKGDHMLIALWLWGFSYQQDMAVIYSTNEHSPPPQSIYKPTHSILHPDIIIVPNRSRICVAWPLRQKQI